MEQRVDVLILGGGPAGITFANVLKSLRPELGVTMLRPEAHSMVYCAIPYAIEGLFDSSKTYKSDALVTGCGAKLIRRAAVKVDLRARRVVDEEGDVYDAGVLFLATGAVPIRPPLPGAEAANVFTVKTEQDMAALITKVREGARRAVVVGAGAIGIEQAQAYVERGIETHLVDIAPQVLPSMLDPEMAEEVHQVLREGKISLRLGTKVTALATEGERVVRVAFSDGEALALDPERDFVCFAVGMRPDIGLFAGQGLETTRDGIVVDAHMRTSIPGVYAAGDCCAGVSFLDGKPASGKLATNAVPMAKVAARTVAGVEDSFPGFINGAATCAFHLRLGGSGFTEAIARQRGMETVSGQGETTNLFPMMPGAGPLRVKIVADAHDLRVVGAQVISTLPVADKVDIVTLAIQQRLTLRELAKLNYSAQPWQSHLPARNAIVAACEAALQNALARRTEKVAASGV